MQEAQRFFLLSQIDNVWKEHLQSMEFLRKAVGLRGYGQRDPLTEYKLEGFELFKEMLARVRRNVIYNVYCFTPQRLTPVQDEGKNGKKQGKQFSRRKAAEKQAVPEKVPAKAAVEA
jgi:preprotein translocase subunit SecA